MSLLALQRDMRDWLDQGSENIAARFPVSARAGLGIYQNNYRAQLAACLEESFPVTLAWLGGDAFHEAVVAHVEADSPSSWTLDRYPCGFPGTLRRLYSDDQEVAELAALELALAEAFVAADAPLLAVDMTKVDWDQAVFSFVPSLSCQPLSTNAPAIWSAVMAGEPPPPATMLPAPGALIVWRSDEACRFRAIEAREAEALRFLRGPNARFGSLCAGLGEEQAEDVGQWLGQWIGDGLIAGISDRSD
jgi:hypothetical protein